MRAELASSATSIASSSLDTATSSSSSSRRSFQSALQAGEDVDLALSKPPFGSSGMQDMSATAVMESTLFANRETVLEMETLSSRAAREPVLGAVIPTAPIAVTVDSADVIATAAVTELEAEADALVAACLATEPHLMHQSSDKSLGSSTAQSRSQSRTIHSLLMIKNHCSPKDAVPVHVAFHKVSYRVPVTRDLWVRWKRLKERATGQWDGSVSGTEKVILQPFSGCMKPGELIAVMGPSGSGKTSFLNVLAGRTRLGTVQGSILYNGVPVNPGMRGKVFGYVLQQDALQENLTVRETFEYALKLRFGNKLSATERRERIEQVIEELGLTACADSMVGGAIRRGISGGEMKRVSIGVELLSHPSVLYLDEPTSGLDSKTALNLCETLVALAAHGRTIICTIHQPQSSIYSLFDKIILLSGGNPVYFGPADLAVDYFALQDLPCPPYSNPSDVFLDNITVDSRGKNLELEGKRRVERLVAAYHQSEYRALNTCEAEEWLSDVKSFDFTFYLKNSAPPGFFERIYHLVDRNFRDSRRNQLVTLSRLLQTVIMGLFLGLLYINLQTDQPSILTRRGALFCIAIEQGLCGFITILAAFHLEKSVYYRELDAGLYSTGSYFLARILTEVPMALINPLIYVCIVYPMVRLQATVYAVSICLLTLIVTTFTAEALGLVVGSVMDSGFRDWCHSDLRRTLSPTHEIANVVSPAFLGLMVIFGGLLISESQAPVYMRWIIRSNYLFYAYKGKFQ